MAQTVIGFFDDAQKARRAVDQLVSNGFNRSQVDISSGNRDGSLPTSETATDADRTSDDRESGITRFFKNLFGDDDDEATRYSKVGMQSNSIVTVHASSSDEAERAADLLDEYGAVNVNDKATSYDETGSSRTGNYDATTAYANTGSNSQTGNLTPDYSDRGNDTTINRVEEEMNVGKRTVETGGVRVRSRIVERPVEENIRLREERVNVERTPVNRELTGDESANFQEQDIELTERAEVPVVNKQARVVEEIRLNKEVNERDETVRDTVRHTEVDVENLSEGNRNRASDSDYDTDTRNTPNNAF